MTNDRWLLTIGLGAAMTLAAACGGEKKEAADDSAGASAETAQAGGGGSASGEQTPDAGREVIKVEMLTDEQGNNIFRPAKVEAHRGDVLRYTLVSGVHNVDFLPDSNAGKTGLPAASQPLQLPGQTHDVKVTFAPGDYYFQCDPHAL